MQVDPTPDEIAAWLSTEHRCDATKARTWAEFLAGLPWRYIRPVVQISVNSRNHPATALATAARFSADQEFVAAASRHLEGQNEPG